MNQNMLTIGQMARENKISEQTLRLYDKEGLLKPLLIDPQTGYRYYSITQSARLDMIQYMKATGMTLKEIHQLLEAGNTSAIKEFLQNRKTSIAQEILELTFCEKAITRTLRNYQRCETLPPCGRIFLEYIPERTIYRFSTNRNFFDQGASDYEYMLRELKHSLPDRKIPNTYFCNVGTLMRKERLIAKEFYADEVFILLDDDFKEGGGVEKLPAGSYLAVCCDNFSEEEFYGKKLIEAVEEGGFSIAGDYLCEVIAEFPIFENEERSMLYKIQIPIHTRK